MSGFVFKQFKVAHDKCAMKVSTDGILLGAWAQLDTIQSVLDIGTGSGLLALMCKQRSPLMTMTAVEVDQSAYLQATQNIALSPWPDIAIYQQRIQDFSSNAPYDMVISNPPYFNNSLKGADAARNAARHTDDLSFTQLISAFKRLTHTGSVFNVILPCPEAQLFITQARIQGLYLQRHCLVKTTQHKPATRSLMCFGYQQIDCVQSQLVIHGDAGQYSDEYTVLCKAFYLKM